MARRKQFRGRVATALAALALAVQVLLPLLLAHELHVDSDDALAVETWPAATATANHATADTAIPREPGHRCTCPICQILAAGQLLALATAPNLAVPQPAPSTLIVLESAPPPPAAFPVSYQARAPPLAG